MKSVSQTGLRTSSGARLAIALLLSVTLGVTLGGCWGRNGDEAVRPWEEVFTVEELGEGRTLVENTVKNIRVTLPDGWEPIKSWRPDADFYAGNEAKELYVMILAENKAELSDFPLTDNASQYRRLLTEQLDRSEGQSPTGVTAINGQNAIQYEIRGAVDNQPLVYLHTTIIGDQNYYQVIGWTKAENYDNRQEELQSVIASFRGQ